jgi:hypothetical protein
MLGLESATPNHAAEALLDRPSAKLELSGGASWAAPLASRRSLETAEWAADLAVFVRMHDRTHERKNNEGRPKEFEGIPPV